MRAQVLVPGIASLKIDVAPMQPPSSVAHVQCNYIGMLRDICRWPRFAESWLIVVHTLAVEVSGWVKRKEGKAFFQSSRFSVLRVSDRNGS